MKIQIDCREPEEVKEALRDLAHERNFEFECLQLPCGDFVCDGNVIERKAASDFVISISDGRLAEQVDRMLRTDLKPWIIIEGNLFEERWGDMSDFSIIGQQVSLVIRKGIAIVITGDIIGSIWAVYAIASKTLDERENTPIANHRFIKKMPQNVSSIEATIAVLKRQDGKRIGYKKACVIAKDGNINTLTDLLGFGMIEYDALRLEGKCKRVSIEDIEAIEKIK